MGRTKTTKKSQGVKHDTSKADRLLEHALTLLQSGEAEQALPLATKALSHIHVSGTMQLPALELLGEIYIELGDPERARQHFLRAAKLDPDATLPLAQGGGADKFLWLAQLSDTGGADSVTWFEKGATVLRAAVAAHEGNVQTEEEEVLLELERRKLANALCGAAEVYMTDLS